MLRKSWSLFWTFTLVLCEVDSFTVATLLSYVRPIPRLRNGFYVGAMHKAGVRLRQGALLPHLLIIPIENHAGLRNFLNIQ